MQQLGLMGSIFIVLNLGLTHIPTIHVCYFSFAAKMRKKICGSSVQRSMLSHLPELFRSNKNMHSSYYFFRLPTWTSQQMPQKQIILSKALKAFTKLPTPLKSSKQSRSWQHGRDCTERFFLGNYMFMSYIYIMYYSSLFLTYIYIYLFKYIYIYMLIYIYIC